MSDVEQFLAGAGAEKSESTEEGRPVLLFRHESLRYGVIAEEVSAVIPSTETSLVPGAGGALAGLVQHRGRIVALAADPLGRPAEASSVQRILVCDLDGQHLGLPAQAEMEIVHVVGSWEHGELLDSPAGSLTFVEPARVRAALRIDD